MKCSVQFIQFLLFLGDVSLDSQGLLIFLTDLLVHIVDSGDGARCFFPDGFKARGELFVFLEKSFPCFYETCLTSLGLFYITLQFMDFILVIFIVLF